MESMKVVEFPLIVKSEELYNELNLKYRLACDIYNDLNNYYQKRYREMTLTRKWVQDTKTLAREFKRLEEEAKDSKESGKKKGKKKKTSPLIKEIYNRRNALIREYGFSDFSFGAKAIQFSSKFAKHIPSNMASMIGARLWAGYEDLLFGNGENVYYKRYKDFNSIRTNGKSGLRLKEVEGKLYVCMGNVRAHAKTYHIPIKESETDYDDFMKREMAKNGVKLLTILREKVKGSYKYTVQITFSGESYEKLTKAGVPKIKHATGRVAINIYNGYLTAINENECKRFYLLDGYDEFKEELARVGAKISALNVKLNPNNYEENGTIKRGYIDEGGRRKRLVWNSNLELRQLKVALSELNRKHTKSEKIRRYKIVNELLELGDEFIVYDCNYAFKLEKPDYVAMLESEEGLPKKIPPPKSKEDFCLKNKNMFKKQINTSFLKRIKSIKKTI